MNKFSNLKIHRCIYSHCLFILSLLKYLFVVSVRIDGMNDFYSM